MLEKIPERLRRTKLWVSVLTPFAAALIAIIVDKLDMQFTELQVTAFAGMVVAAGMTYVFSQGKVDEEKEKLVGNFINGGHPIEIPVKLKIDSGIDSVDEASGD